MAQLFVEASEQDLQRVRWTGEERPAPRWAMAPLRGDAFELVSDGEAGLRPRVLRQRLDGVRTPLLLRFRPSERPSERTSESAAELWAVMQPRGASLRVNGVSVGAGIRVLSHRDELRLVPGQGRAFFSSEELPVVRAFDGVEGARCPRCKLPMESTQLAVCCPNCKVWHHEGGEGEEGQEGIRCWTYASQCAVCIHPTGLDGELQWVPEEEAGEHG